MNHLFQLKCISAILLIVMCSYSVNGFAETQGKKKTKVTQQQTEKEDYGNTVSLVTSGTGKTKEEATKNALRSAIEQVFGTFVSSNTQVLNDEIIKDEIVSISSGNVLGYEEISSVELPDGYNVSVKSVVSIGKLVSYTESHGASTELAGNTFLRNRDLAILNKKNESKAISHMIEQIILIWKKGLFNFSLDVSEPKGTGDKIKVGIRVKATPNENMKAFWDIVDHTLSSLNMEESEMKNYEKIGFKTSYNALALDKQLDDGCDIDKIIVFGENGDRMGRPNKTIRLRNDYFCNLDHYLQLLMVLSRFNFEIYDNLGTSIYLDVKKWDNKGEFYLEQKKHDACYAQYAGGIANAYFFDIVNNKKDPYIEAKFFYDEKISRVMKEMIFNLYYSSNSLSQLKNISIRPAY